MTVQSTDPRSGFFAFVHHDIPLEYSWDIDERIRVIETRKPPNERATRLRCLTYAPDFKVPAGLHWARRAYDEAGRAHNEAQRVYNETWRAHDEARRVYNEAERAYNEARRVYNEAGYAPDCLELALNLVPDAPWANGTLVFPKD